ncbi:hypothetical protein WA026_012654 [Henosepilachna vigintioctopunctata]|uniref:Serine hydrolase domain-containing protein n=1 Tax=Henosepilachna vigintioctopunctata TaxID=420089 RepID=A0AAW1U5X8_9CUCU
MSFNDRNRKNKLKILALHGYRQNAVKFLNETKNFCEAFSQWAEFVYITAPHQVVLVDNPDNLLMGEKLEKGQRGWFFNRRNKTNRGIRNGGPAIGFNDTVRVIEEVFRDAGPFDGILGFSQGACLAGILSNLQQSGLIKAKFNFAIIISGFMSKCLPHMKYFQEVINLPSLHVIGDNDQIIPNKMSQELSDCFENPLVVRHPGGHIIPDISQELECYQYFIQKQHALKYFS